MRYLGVSAIRYPSTDTGSALYRVHVINFVARDFFESNYEEMSHAELIACLAANDIVKAIDFGANGKCRHGTPITLLAGEKSDVLSANSRGVRPRMTDLPRF